MINDKPKFGISIIWILLFVSGVREANEKKKNAEVITFINTIEWCKRKLLILMCNQICISMCALNHQNGLNFFGHIRTPFINK